MIFARGALGLAVLTFMGLLLLGADWLLVAPIRASDSRIVALQDELSQILERKSRMRSSSSSASPVLPAWAPDLSGNASDAATRFQGVVKDAISAVGGSTLSSQANAAEIKPGLSKITIMLRARFSEKAMLKFVRAIEASTPSLKLESMEARQIPTGAGIAGAGAELDFSGVILGLHQNEN